MIYQNYETKCNKFHLHKKVTKAKMYSLKKDVEAKMYGVEAKMDSLNKGVEAKMNDMVAKMDGMEAKMNGMDAKMDGMDDKMEELKINMNNLLQEMVTNGERVVKETHDENKINVNHDFIDSNIRSKNHHVAKIDMKKFDGKDPVTCVRVL